MAESILGLISLILLEVSLGVDNLLFISLVLNRLDERLRRRAWQVGLLVAVGARLLMVGGLWWLVALTRVKLFEVGDMEWSLKEAIFFLGGAFLIARATMEIFHNVEGKREKPSRAGSRSLWGAIIEIVLVDVIFALDSALTAVGLSKELWVIIVAIVGAAAVMGFAAGPLSRFMERHPSFIVLGLAFMLMVGMLLVLEAFHIEVPRGYVYSALLFSVMVELLQMRLAAQRQK